MLIPRRPNPALTETDVLAIIQNGTLDFGQLDGLIPRGTPNTWNAQPTDRIKYGFKYEWVSPDGTRWHVHGHAPDPQAPHNSNASNGWVVRIKCNNKFLMDTPNAPAQGGSHWTRNPNNANKTHVPATSQALRDKLRRSQ